MLLRLSLLLLFQFLIRLFCRHFHCLLLNISCTLINLILIKLLLHPQILELILRQLHVLIRSLIKILPQFLILLHHLLILLLHLSLQQIYRTHLDYLLRTILRRVLLRLPRLHLIPFLPVLPNLRLLPLVLLIQLFLLPLVLLHHGSLFLIPAQSALLKRLMLQVQLLQFLRCRRQDLLAVEPGHKVRVLVETILFQETVEDHATCRETVEGVVLVVFVAEFVNTYDLTTDGLVFLLDVPLTPTRTLACDAK